MFNKRHIVRTIAATVSILALSFTAACGSGQSTASNSTDSDDITQQTYKPGKLTIATTGIYTLRLNQFTGTLPEKVLYTSGAAISSRSAPWPASPATCPAFWATSAANPWARK